MSGEYCSSFYSSFADLFCLQNFCKNKPTNWKLCRLFTLKNLRLLMEILNVIKFILCLILARMTITVTLLSLFIIHPLCHSTCSGRCTRILVTQWLPQRIAWAQYRAGEGFGQKTPWRNIRAGDAGCKNTFFFLVYGYNVPRQMTIWACRVYIWWRKQYVSGWLTTMLRDRCMIGCCCLSDWFD